MTDDLPHAQVPIPPPAIFAGFLVAALLLNWVVPLPAPWLGVLREVGGFVILAGLGLGFWAIRLMAKAHTSADPHQPTKALLTEGPYGRTRNPIYLGFLLIFIGFTILAGTIWGILLSPLLLVTVTRAVVRAEETYLEAKFESRYFQYKSRVRQWL
jgi:protein-S-isoprenylcysteine O-methyltransferase Ste14